VGAVPASALEVATMGVQRRPATALAYGSADEMLFGRAKRPVECGLGVTIGGGEVLPEVNFTLPPMLVRSETLEKVRQSFRDIVTRVLTRAVELGQPALVLEFEQLFEMTRNPEWGAAMTGDMKAVMADFHARHGLRSALRVTIADIRDEERPPKMRSGAPRARVIEAFDRCAAAGADILSIESTGGKEVSDQALMTADVDGLAYALGVLCPLDMEALWGDICQVAAERGVVAGGDTACGFGNTAMQLAHQNLIPRVLAAVVRLMTAPRSLVAVEMGARGPLKDCGYENPVIKALTGVPVSMEGKASACAHSSPVGNIAAAVCDLWSNESVQDVRLLGGFAPECWSEVLVYDCRLMNQAAATGQGALLRNLFVASDRDRDPQALVLDPEVMVGAAQRIADAGPDHYARAKAMAQYAVEVIDAGVTSGRLQLTARDERWRGIVSAGVEALPDDPEALRGRLDPSYRELFIAREYGL
jgi:methanol--5-hydroxybenzimidazolylcobamide Co-methyltransferase